MALLPVRVFVGAEWRAGGNLEGGRAATCRDGEVAARALADAHGAWQALPPRLRTERVDVHLVERPPRDGSFVVRYLPARDVIAVEVGRVEHVGRGVWLHELVHQRARGHRPSQPVAGRVLAAVDEGVADFVAATVARSVRLGPVDEGGRDLSRPPAPSAADWAFVGLPGARSPTHRLGWRLAAELWREAPGSEELAVDAVVALASYPEGAPDRDAPGPALGALVRACPERSRGRLRAALGRWVPAELFPD